jgi:Na+/H+ antiporter NhaD/arsenite permease-like protein
MMPPLFAAAPTVLPNEWMVLPFVLLLLCIATLPIAAHRFWEHHYPKIASALGLITTAYYLFVLKSSTPVLHAIDEYINFMSLIGSLYVISGGINIRVRGEATPFVNVVFLLIGAVLANIIGTTGASMLLIRPWIRMNKIRITGFHVVFFIFIVSNAGGCLTPIGDPPLFLGFLRGVPFWWIFQHAWPAWLLVVGLLLIVFYLLDRKNFLRAPADVRAREEEPEQWNFRGLPNAFLLLVVLIAVFLPHHWKVGTNTFGVTVSALLMLAAALASWKFTPQHIHEANDFNFEPVREVGWLFIGIFLTMMPALDLLAHGDLIKLSSPVQYYFACGTLSAFLDNAPTYLTFLASEMGSHQLDIGSPADVLLFVEKDAPFLLAVSLGAVFFGAGTYLGNGPNFMVKAICTKANVRTPGFLGYLVGYTLPFLVPILILVGWLMVAMSH